MKGLGRGVQGAGCGKKLKCGVKRVTYGVHGECTAGVSGAGTAGKPAMDARPGRNTPFLARLRSATNSNSFPQQLVGRPALAVKRTWNVLAEAGSNLHLEP